MTDETAAARERPPSVTDGRILSIVAAYAGLFIVGGLLLDGPSAVASGLIRILGARDTLVTDYMGIGGIGAALVSAGLLTLAACWIYQGARATINGSAVACLFLVLGFGLFGKNLLNVWGIVAGVLLYSRLRGELFARHINTAFFGAALAPIFSEILFSSSLTLAVSIPLSIATTLVIGLILVPAAAQLFKAHMGFSLYNMGFTAGIVGTLVVALYRSYGFVPVPVFIWTTGNNGLLAPALFAMFASMAVLGLLIDRDALHRQLDIWHLSGRSPTDFIAAVGFGATLVNMAATGAIGTAYVLVVGGDLNGPTIGAILSIVGFAAAGKHSRNILPIMAGVFIGSIAKPWNAGDPSIVLAALFGTTLAPIAGRFGWHWGIVAGFIHSSAALAVGDLHGGLVLYNNGFAAGLVASVLVPIILAIHRNAPENETAQPAPPPPVRKDGDDPP